jgi:hypothetical protein
MPEWPGGQSGVRVGSESGLTPLFLYWRNDAPAIPGAMTAPVFRK